MSLPHDTIPIQVWVDVDMGIADAVVYLNTLPGIRTLTSCQGTLDEGGPQPYRPYVMCSWTPEAAMLLSAEFDVDPQGNGLWGYVYPREKAEGSRSGAVQAERSGAKGQGSSDR